MASTTGGFLTGVGLCMLLICFGGIKVMEPVSWEIQGARRRIGLIYRTTHSLTYWDVMSDLDTLAPKATWLADNLGGIPGAGGLASSLRQIPEVASLMHEFYSSSETAYHALERVEIVHMYLAYGMVAGALFFIVGLTLIVRPRLRESRRGG